MKKMRGIMPKVFASVMLSSTLLLATNAVTDKIAMTKVESSKLLNKPNNLMHASSINLVNYKINIYNKSNLVLKDIKLNSKIAIKCPKSNLVAGELMECSYIATKDDNSAIKLSGKYYNVKVVKAVETDNANFNDAGFSWKASEGVDFDSIDGDNISAIINGEKASISKEVKILKDKLYRVSIDAQLIKGDEKQALIELQYLDKNGKVIKDYTSKKSIEKSPFDNKFLTYKLMLPKSPKNVEFIKVLVNSNGVKVAIDNLKVEEVTVNNRGYRVVKTLDNSIIDKQTMAPLCNCNGRVGDHVWIDTNRNGYQDEWQSC